MTVRIVRTSFPPKLGREASASICSIVMAAGGSLSASEYGR
jgi:hypothetical protein